MLTFAVYLQDHPGALNRVASLFRRRAINIASLTVGHTETVGVSRMTVVVDAPEEAAARVAAHLYKLLDVERVEVIPPAAALDRDLALIKVSATSDTRSAIMQLVSVFRARVVDVAPDSMIVEITGTEEKIDGLLDVLLPYGVIEMVRTGRVSMSRGGQELKSARRRARSVDAADSATIAYSV